MLGVALATLSGASSLAAADAVTPGDYAYGAVLETDAVGAVYTLPLPGPPAAAGQSPCAWAAAV
jgi:hypothetical protein